ncbi:MAG TPA: hypothetical protein ENI52_03015 [Thermoplasmata archaeon]|nr:hypothetical protein [Thermoplasmata archaeon]
MGSHVINNISATQVIDLFSNYTSDDILEEASIEKLEDHLIFVNPEEFSYKTGFSDKDFFLFLIFDTNLLLDIIWKRNKKIIEIYNRLTDNKFYWNKESEIILSTTIINVVEIFDKIRFCSDALSLYELKVSPDEVIRVYHGKEVSNKYKNNDFEFRSYKKAYTQLKKLCKILNNFWILYPDIDLNPEDIIVLRNLIFRGSIRDKDALIAWIANKYSEFTEYGYIEGPYFLTTDKNLAKAEVVNDLIFYVYNLGDKKEFQEFVDNVLKSWINLEFIEIAGGG